MENRVKYNGDASQFGKIVMIDGEPMFVTPTHYRRSFINETGGITVELSLTPFKD